MHEDFTMLMSVVLDHEAPPGDVARLRQHLTDCPACARTWAHWQSLDSYLARASMLTPAPGFVLRVAERLEARKQQTSRRGWLGSGLLLAWAGIATVLWLILVAGAAWGFTHPLEVSQLLSSGAHFFGGLVSLLRALQAMVVDLGALWLSLGVGFYLGLTALVLLVWASLLLHKSPWLRPLFAAGERAADS